jgi:tRNA A-37 threonylcarbamoyl transferase component Bud32
MESRHHEHYPECFNEATKSYAKKSEKGKQVMERFKKVNLRGRNKAKH